MHKRNYVIHTPTEIEGIRQATRLTAMVRDTVCRTIKPGMSTLEVDQLAAQLITDAGAKSAFYNYRGFPGHICISVNDEVVHGIGRADRIIQMGDIVSMDFGVRYRGYIGDSARTICIGPPTPQIANLLAVTEQSLMAGIDAAAGHNTVNAIGTAIEKTVTAAGFSVVRDFVGHGCGVDLHEPPEVPNYATKKATERLRPGMVLAIEPMVNIGVHKVKIDDDGWTVRTLDNSLSAHFEHMILITNQQPEILTWQKTA